MSAPSIPKVKEKLRSVSSVDAGRILNEVMKLEDGDAIKEYLYKAL